MNERSGLRGDHVTTGRDDEVHAAAPDHLAHGALCRLAQGQIRVQHIKQIELGVVDAILNGELEIDDVLVFGQHQGFVGDGAA